MAIGRTLVLFFIERGATSNSVQLAKIDPSLGNGNGGFQSENELVRFQRRRNNGHFDRKRIRGGLVSMSWPLPRPLLVSTYKLIAE